GAGEVSLLELTAAYEVFADGGIRRPPALITGVASSTGEMLYTSTSEATQVVDPALAYLITYLLGRVVDVGTRRGARGGGRGGAGRGGGGQDRHDGRHARRLVRRLHAGGRDGRVGRLRSRAQHRAHGRARRGPDLDRLHACDRSPATHGGVPGTRRHRLGRRRPDDRAAGPAGLPPAGSRPRAFDQRARTGRSSPADMGRGEPGRHGGGACGRVGREAVRRLAARPLRPLNGTRTTA